jgi:isoamylase
MVKAFHDAGIKVYVDVVYNHTGEGGAWGGSDGTHRLQRDVVRGLDNPTYYSLTSDRQYSWDNTGVGGNYNTRNTIAQNLIVDSLAYWRDALGVDGFRFDLASVLGNTCEHGCFNFDKMDAATRSTASSTSCRRGRGRRQRRRSDRRAVGDRRQPIRSAAFPSGLGRVERQVPRRGAQEAEPARRRDRVTPGTLASASPARRISTATTAASPGTRSTSWSRTTASRCAICTPTTASRTTSRGRTAPPTAATTTTTAGTRAASAPTSARPRAPAWRS